MTQAPGWYPDPEDPTQQRWWNGLSWSDETVTGAQPAAPVRPVSAASTTPPPPSTSATAAAAPSPSVVDTAPQSTERVTAPYDDPFTIPPRTITVWSWFIALSPMAAFVAYASLIAVGAVEEYWTPLGIVFAFGFLVAILWLAAMDRWRLQQRGFINPASILWNLLSPQVYLLARAISLKRGDGQRWIVFFGSLIVVVLTLVAASRFAAVVDAHDTQVVEDSIADELNHQNGLDVEVSCPDSPPEGQGETFRCTVDPTGSGPMLVAHVRWTDDHGHFTYTLRAES